MPTAAAADSPVERLEQVTVMRAAGGGALEPADWPQRAAEAIACFGGNAIILPKRIAVDGRLAAMGERVVHPKGLHATGRGLPATAHRFPLETDGALEGLLCAPHELAERLPRPEGRLGLLTCCLEARLLGASVIALPEVRWRADAPTQPLEDKDLRAFRERFGFHPLAPDLDDIAGDARLAPLRWDRRWFGRPLPFEKYSERGAFHWKAYEEHKPFRERAEHLVRFAGDAFAGSRGAVLDAGCGDGLFTERLATRCTMIGLDDDADAMAAARERAPNLDLRQGSIYALPFEAGSLAGAVAFDVIEHLHNPARALRELARILAPGAPLILSTPEWQYGGMSDPTYHVCEFTLEELVNLLQAEGLFGVETTARIGGIYRDLVVLARRLPSPSGSLS